MDFIKFFRLVKMDGFWLRYVGDSEWVIYFVIMYGIGYFFLFFFRYMLRFEV